MPSIITKEEFETPRQASEILDWVVAAHNRFTATRELRSAAREGKFFAKELVEEAFPIALFAHRYYDASSDVEITLILGNQNYDATVEDRRTNSGPIKFIEATVSDWSYEEALRMELLNADRSAPAYGKIRAAGPRGRRTSIEAESIALNHDETREQHIAGVIAAVNRKADKTYPDGTALVVRVDDALPFRDEDDVSILDEVAQFHLFPLLSEREFRVLALEGTRSVHLAYEL